MALPEVHWERHVLLPAASPCHSRIVVGMAALLCFINSYDGDFVFDDSEAIINNKVTVSTLQCTPLIYEIPHTAIDRNQYFCIRPITSQC